MRMKEDFYDLNRSYKKDNTSCGIVSDFIFNVGSFLTTIELLLMARIKLEKSK
jgi:hypothetical protein